MIACQTYVNAGQVQLGAAVARENVKNAKYKAECEKVGAVFVPFVMETYGGISRTARGFINLVSVWSKDNSIIDDGIKLTTEFYQTASCAVQRGNASIAHFGLVKSANANDENH